MALSEESTDGRSALPARICLIKMPRTASNLLMRLLSAQPGLLPASNEMTGYFFRQSRITEKRLTFDRDLDPNLLSPEELKLIRTSKQRDLDSLMEHLDRSKAEGKTAFWQEHIWPMVDFRSRYQWTMFKEVHAPLALSYRGTPATSTSPLEVPDEVLSSIRPIMLMRHPAIMFRSALKAIMAQNASFANTEIEGTFSLRWMRILYQWYTENAAADKLPVILEADDFINDESVLHALCTELGLDASSLVTSWGSASEEQIKKIGAVDAHMHGSLNASTCIVKTRDPASIILDDEHKQWKEEFGEDDASKLRSLVWDAMPDYQWLRERRLIAHRK